MEENQNSKKIDLTVFDTFDSLTTEILMKGLKQLSPFEDPESQELKRIGYRIKNLHQWLEEDQGLPQVPVSTLNEIRYLLLQSYLFLASQYPESLNEINYFINRIKKLSDRRSENEDSSSKE